MRQALDVAAKQIGLRLAEIKTETSAAVSKAKAEMAARRLWRSGPLCRRLTLAFQDEIVSYANAVWKYTVDALEALNRERYSNTEITEVKEFINNQFPGTPPRGLIEAIRQEVATMKLPASIADRSARELAKTTRHERAKLDTELDKYFLGKRQEQEVKPDGVPNGGNESESKRTRSLREQERRLLQVIHEKGKPWVLQVDVARALGYPESGYGEGRMAPTGHHFDPEFARLVDALKQGELLVRDITDSDIDRPEWQIRLTGTGYQRLSDLEASVTDRPGQQVVHTDSPTSFDFWIRKIKKNPLVAVLLLIGVAIIGLGEVTGAVDTIWTFFENRLFQQEVISETVPLDLENINAGPTQDVLEQIDRERNYENIPVPTGESNLSFLEYVQTFANIYDNFLQRDAFIEDLLGKKVTWEGYVGDVMDGRSGIMLAILLFKDNDPVKMISVIHFPESFRTQLYSFRADDHVLVEGIYTGAELGFPTLEGISVSYRQ